jgi:quinol monooxygenase YgiN
LLLITGTFRIPPEKLGEARKTMEQMVRSSRAEDGCIDYSYAEDFLEPGLIRVAEAWTDKAALDAHFASEHLARWRAMWPALNITDRDLTLHDVSASRPT